MNQIYERGQTVEWHIVKNRKKNHFVVKIIVKTNLGDNLGIENS
jgi:hypothetical protein